MVSSPSFTHTPVTLSLILASTIISIVVSIVDVKHLIPLRPTPHLYPYLQLSRIFTYQAAYTNSTELLFSAVLLYHLRVLERIWGSRKYASFVLSVYGVNSVLVPVVLGTVVSLLSWGKWNYLPGGLTGLVCAGVACWREEVPSLYQYKITTGHGVQQQEGSEQNAGHGPKGIILSDKATSYVLAAQLALSQFPYSLLPAGIGWVVGLAWRGDLLPGGMGRWRIPHWMIGEGGMGKEGRRSREERERYEGLRRRLEEEGSTGDGMRATGSAPVVDNGEVRTRGITGQVREYFRAVF